MSDGNFNRSMLPYNNYQSGNRAGRAQMKKLAVDAFNNWCAETFPDKSEEERRAMCVNFKQRLP